MHTHVVTYVQNLNLLQPKLWPAVQFTEKWDKKLTYNAYNNYNATTTWKCDDLSLAETSAELKMFR